MRDASGGRPTLDDIGGLEKLLNLFLVERLFVSSQRLPRNAQGNDDASKNDKKGYHQASGKFSHRGPSEIACTVRRRACRNNFMFAPPGGHHRTTLPEIPLYTSVLQHYPLSVC